MIGQPHGVTPSIEHVDQRLWRELVKVAIFEALFHGVRDFWRRRAVTRVSQCILGRRNLCQDHEVFFPGAVENDVFITNYKLKSVLGGNPQGKHSFTSPQDWTSSGHHIWGTTGREAPFLKVSRMKVQWELNYSTRHGHLEASHTYLIYCGEFPPPQAPLHRNLMWQWESHYWWLSPPESSALPLQLQMLWWRVTNSYHQQVFHCGSEH